MTFIMRGLIARELTVATRSAAVPAAGLVLLAASTAFVLAWAPGVALLAPMDLYDQTRGVQWILLALVLPWAAVRSSPVDRTDSVELLAALARTRTGSAMVAKVVGSFAVSMMVILTGLPALILAQQAAAIPMSSVLIDLLLLAGLALLVAATTTGAILVARDGLRAWLCASAVVFGVMLAAVAWAPRVSSLALLCAAAGALGTAGLSTSVGRPLPRSNDTHGA
jgi:hypothetical protein